METHTPAQIPSLRGTPAREAAGAYDESSANTLLLQQLTRSVAALADAVHAHDVSRAHRWACEIRELGWSRALPGPAATAGVLAMRLSNNHTSPGEIDLALSETFAEVYQAISRLV